MGAILSVPVARLKAASKESLRGELIALVPDAGRPIAERMRVSSHSRNQLARVRGGTTIADRQRLLDHLTAEAHHTAHIPIESQSLNAATAATIGLYELTPSMPRA
jgi:hypothetical protein